MKKSYSIFLSILFCFLFCSLSAQDAQLNAASRKVIIEAPAEPGTHLEVAYRPAGSFFPSYVQSGQQVDVGTTLIIDAYSDNPTKLPLVAVRVNGEEIEKSGSGYTYVIPEGEGDIVISAEFGLLYQVDFSYSLNGRIELYAAGSEEPLTTGTRVNGNVEITVKVIPDSGCDLLSLVVNDENVTGQLANNEYKFVLNLKSATKLFSVLLASKRPLITELADKLRLKYPLLPTISPCPTMRLEAIRSIIPISCRRYPKSV